MQQLKRFSDELLLEGMWWTNTKKQLNNISKKPNN